MAALLTKALNISEILNWWEFGRGGVEVWGYLEIYPNSQHIGSSHRVETDTPIHLCQ